MSNDQIEFWIQEYLQGKLDEEGAAGLLGHLENSVELRNRLGTNVYADFLLSEKYHVAKGIQAAELAGQESIAAGVAALSDGRTATLERESQGVSWRWYSIALSLLLVLSISSWVSSYLGVPAEKDRKSGALYSGQKPEIPLPEPVQAARFVSIAQTKNCFWADSMTQTHPGTRLGKCRLKLQQGVALLHFDCGASVSIEGPCEFEIKDEKFVVLHSGRLVASVETEEGAGFIVDTPGARITDFGTKFCVNALSQNQTAVDVIDGNVEVASKSATQILSLRKGESVVLGASSPKNDKNKNDIDSLVSVIQVSTVSGRGCESWVVMKGQTILTATEFFPDGASDTLMHVKLSMPEDAKSDRKAIFRMDLKTFEDKSRIVDAELLLSYCPTRIGYASHSPDATFRVYGLTDENSDLWDENSITWNSFPGNGPRQSLDSARWTMLDTFQITQGSQSGIIRLGSKAILDFIGKDTNGLVSFAIVCDTPATALYGLVHGFANRNHPTLSPPRLYLTINGQ